MSEPEDLKPSLLRQELLKRHSENGSIAINGDLILELKDGEFMVNGLTGKTIEYASMDQLKSIRDYLQPTNKDTCDFIPGFEDKTESSEGEKSDASIIPD